MADRSIFVRAGARLVGAVYGGGARLHRALATGSRPLRGRPACAVVSVGGLTVGGAGKTPAAAAVASALARTGLRVVLASRGYGGRGRSRVEIVSDGRRVHARVERTGDESLVLAAHAPGVPVLVGKDRRVVGHRAVSGFDAEVLVLDDGFQHHGLDRDFDLVCVDGVSGLGNRRVVPAGPLREPVAALRLADALLLVDPDPAQASLERALRRELRPGVPIFRARRFPTGLAPLGGGGTVPPETLAGQDVGLIAGIARPASLRRSLEALGANVVAERTHPDHHVYTRRDLVGLEEARVRGAQIHWITTEKDGYKILPRWVAGARVSVLRMEARLEGGEALCREICRSLREQGRLGGGVADGA